jgi:hypothetical protein
MIGSHAAATPLTCRPSPPLGEADLQELVVAGGWRAVAMGAEVVADRAERPQDLLGAGRARVMPG